MAPSTKRSAAPQPFPIPARTLLRPPVLFELLLGISPLAGVLWWQWDVYLLVMLHVLALAVSGAALVLRTLTLSREALGYFALGSPLRARLLLSAFTLFVIAVPLMLLSGVITDEFGGAWRVALRSSGDAWRVLIVGTGLWLPLACVCVFEAASFAADVVLPRLPLARRFSVPARPVAAAYRTLSRELQAFLYVRAFVTL